MWWLIGGSELRESRRKTAPVTDTVPYLFRKTHVQPGFHWKRSRLIFFNPHPRTRLLTLGGGGRDGERNINPKEKYLLVSSCTCPQRLNLQPRHVSWPGIEPTTFWFIGLLSNQVSTLARARLLLDKRSGTFLQGG